MTTEQTYVTAATVIIVTLILCTSQCSMSVNKKAMECIQGAKDAAAAQLCERLGVH